MKRIFKTLCHLFLPLSLGIIVSLLTKNNMDYSNLTKPLLSPPKIVFPIVWSIIYLLLGISFYLYKKEGKESTKTDIIYYLGLFFNCLWTIIFFNFKLRLLAFFWILILDYLVYLLFKEYTKYSKTSSYLIIPYLIWLVIATYLNLGIYLLN